MDALWKEIPATVLRRADLRWNELAWHPEDIPAVIEAARLANLLNLGGDLQIRAPSGGTGEPIGVGVDTNRVPGDLPWHPRVQEAARVALSDFHALREKLDFEAVARDAFPQLLQEVQDPSEAIFFTWFVLAEQ